MFDYRLRREARASSLDGPRENEALARHLVRAHGQPSPATADGLAFLESLTFTVKAWHRDRPRYGQTRAVFAADTGWGVPIVALLREGNSRLPDSASEADLVDAMLHRLRRSPASGMTVQVFWGYHQARDFLLETTSTVWVVAAGNLLEQINAVWPWR